MGVNTEFQKVLGDLEPKKKEKFMLIKFILKDSDKGCTYSFKKKFVDP